MNASGITRKKIFFLVITAFIGIALGLLLGEMALRVAGPSWLRQLMVGTNLDGEIHYGSDKGWPVESRNGKFLKFKPFKEFKVDYFEYHTLVHTDQWGGRVTAKPNQSNNEEFIPVLGDSFAFGLGVRDEETFVSLVSQNSKVSCVNLAAPGSSLPNDLDIIEFRHEELGSPAKYVITFYLGNDYSDMIQYYEDQTNQKSVESDGGFSEFIRKIGLLRRSYVGQFIMNSAFSHDDKMRTKHKTKIFRAPGGQRLGSSLYLLMSHSKSYCSQAFKALDRSLDRLEELSDHYHFTPIFVVIPDKHQTDQSLLLKQAEVFQLPLSELDLYYPNRMLEENLEKRGIEYLDVTSCLKDKPGLYYKIDDHLTAAGNRVVAECIRHDSKWAQAAELMIDGKR